MEFSQVNLMCLMTLRTSQRKGYKKKSPFIFTTVHTGVLGWTLKEHLVLFRVSFTLPVQIASVEVVKMLLLHFLYYHMEIYKNSPL